MGFGTGNKQVSSDGIFLDTVTIKRTRPYYDEKPSWAAYPFELALEVFYDVSVGDKGWETSVLIKMHPKKDDLGRVKSIPDGFKVDQLFQAAGITPPDPTEDGKFPEDALRDLVGRQIRVLSYRNTRTEPGALKTSRWDIVGKPDGSEDDRLRDQFLTGYNDRGWPKNYQPNAPSAASDPISDSFGTPPPF